MKHTKTTAYLFVSIIFLACCFAAASAQEKEQRVVGCEPRPRPGSPIIESHRRFLADFESAKKEVAALEKANPPDLMLKRAELINSKYKTLFEPFLRAAEGDEYWEQIALGYANDWARQAAIFGVLSDKDNIAIFDYMLKALRRAFDDTYARCMRDGKECHPARLAHHNHMLGVFDRDTVEDTIKVFECACRANSKSLTGTINYESVQEDKDSKGRLRRRVVYQMKSTFTATLKMPPDENGYARDMPFDGNVYIPDIPIEVTVRVTDISYTPYFDKATGEKKDRREEVQWSGSGTFKTTLTFDEYFPEGKDIQYAVLLKLPDVEPDDKEVFDKVDGRRILLPGKYPRGTGTLTGSTTKPDEENEKKTASWELRLCPERFSRSAK